MNKQQKGEIDPLKLELSLFLPKKIKSGWQFAFSVRVRYENADCIDDYGRLLAIEAGLCICFPSFMC